MAAYFSNIHIHVCYFLYSPVELFSFECQKVICFALTCILHDWLTAPFNNMRTLKFKAQPTNAFFATVNQLFGSSAQLPTILSELCSTI